MRISARATFLLSLLGACALLRSRTPGEVEWNILVFPSADRQEADAAAGRAHVVAGTAAGCVSPDSVTFAAAFGCDATSTGGHRLTFVTSWGSDRYRPDLLRVLMEAPLVRGIFARQATRLAVSRGHDGIILDFPGLGPRDVDGLAAVVSALRDSARTAGIMTTGMVVPAADTAAYPGRQFGAITDYVVIRLEQPWGTAGPLSPRGAMTRFVGVRAGEIGASRLVAAIPVYGVIRREGEDPARISHAEAHRTAADWGIRLERDDANLALFGRHPRLGEIWVPDAVAISLLVRDARRLGVTRFALYGLSGEDPAIWSDVVARSSPQTMIRSR